VHNLIGVMGMCVLWYELAPEDHWADATPGAEPSGAARSARHRRRRLLAAVLAPYGLTVSDPGTGPHWVIGNHKGAAEVAAGLPAIWQAADRLSSRPVDVLDPTLLDALGRGGG
jgi:hypothetical protein